MLVNSRKLNEDLNAVLFSLKADSNVYKHYGNKNTSHQTDCSLVVVGSTLATKNSHAWLSSVLGRSSR